MNNRNCPHCNCSIGVIRFSTEVTGIRDIIRICGKNPILF